jgi:hypothetical protein
MEAASMVELLIVHCREKDGWRVCILKLPEVRAVMGTGSMKLK